MSLGWVESGGVILGAAALVQPWAIAAWRKYARPGHVEFYETGNIEIGFGPFGATLGLMGTLHAVHHEQFVRRIVPEVVNERTNSRHHFEWRVFRPNTYAVGGRREDPMELPAAFLVSPSQPHRFNIVFWDATLEQEMSDIFERVKALWDRFQPEYWKDIREAHAKGDTGTFDERDTRHAEAIAESQYKEMTQTDDYKRVAMDIDRQCFWWPDPYTLEVGVETARPQRIFTKPYHFMLTEDQSKALRENFINTIREVIGLRIFPPYNFVNVSYESG